MSKRLKLGIDVDGVCGDFLSRAYEMCREFCGKPVPGAVQTSWGFDSLGITRDEVSELWKRIDATQDWWLGHEALPGTTFLPRMAEDHEIYFITARQQGLGLPIEEQTKIWLASKFGILYPNVIVSTNKGPIAKALELDYFIDDRDKNCYEVMSALGPDKQHCVFVANATYNQHVTDVVRAVDLDDFFDKIGALDGRGR